MENKELSVKEVFEAISEICKRSGITCNDCAIKKLVGNGNCLEKIPEHLDEVIKILKQWKDSTNKSKPNGLIYAESLRKTGMVQSGVCMKRILQEAKISFWNLSRFSKNTAKIIKVSILLYLNMYAE